MGTFTLFVNGSRIQSNFVLTSQNWQKNGMKVENLIEIDRFSSMTFVGDLNRFNSTLICNINKSISTTKRN